MTTIDQEFLLTRIKSALIPVFGDRLKGVVLFGSEARGDARPDSDIDVLVLLNGKVSVFDDMMKISGVNIPIEWDIEPPRIIDATPVSYDDYKAGKWPLFREVKKDGITA